MIYIFSNRSTGNVNYDLHSANANTTIFCTIPLF